LKSKLSILIACFNEEKTIVTLLEKIARVNLIHGTEKEIIVVDDASTDKSYSLIKDYFSQRKEIRFELFQHQQNKGKGAAIRLAIEKATGDIVVIQDADLEYEPENYNILLSPIIENYADVVYGSRFVGSEPHRTLFFFHAIGNRLLTFLSNLLTQINLTDMETGLKMFKTDVLRKITLRENRFGFEPEVTAKISRIKGIRIFEVGISYFGRTFEEGKKINWKDGIRAVYCIFKYNVFKRK
jgi:glycosyltransferase involved in cell wall biosynthesis